MRTRATRNRRGKARLPLLERLEDRTVPSAPALTPSFSLLTISFTPGQSAASHAEHAEPVPQGLAKHLGPVGGESTTSATSPTVPLAESASARPAVSLVALVIDLTPASSTPTPPNQAPASNSTTTADAGLTGQAASVTALSTGLPSAGTSSNSPSSDTLTATPAPGTTPAGNTTTPANGTPATTTSFSVGIVLVGEGVAGQLVLTANTNVAVPPAAVPVLGVEGTAQPAPAAAVRLTGGSFGQGDWLLEAPARQAPEDQPGEGPAPVPVPVPGKENPDDLFTDPAARDTLRALPEKPADLGTPADEAAVEREVPGADVRPEGVAEQENAAAFDLGHDDGPRATADFFPPELAAVTASDQLLESAESLTAGEGGWWNYLGAMTLAATATASEVLRRRARLAEEEEGIDEETLVARLDRPWA